MHDHGPHDDPTGVKDELGLWLVSTGAILAISLCGVFGVLVIPIIQKVFYQHLIQFLVALAIGTLAGDALLRGGGVSSLLRRHVQHAGRSLEIQIIRAANKTSLAWIASLFVNDKIIL